MFTTRQPLTQGGNTTFVSQYLVAISIIEYAHEELKVLSIHPDKYNLLSHISDLIILKENMLEKKHQLLAHFKIGFIVVKS